MSDLCEIDTGVGYTLFISSIAGIATCCAVKELNVAFDMGCVFPQVLSKRNIFLSHGHIDHINAVPTHCARRFLSDKTHRNNYYVPDSINQHLTQIMKSFSAMQNDTIPANIVSVSPESRIELGGNYFVKPFPTVHRVDSLGYIVYKERRKLKGSYRALPGKEIGELKKKGVDIFDIETTPEIVYTGDTTIDILNGEFQHTLLTAKVLIMELTFVDDRVSKDTAIERGHVHLDQVAELANSFRNEAIVFMHFSARYSGDQLREAVERALPKSLLGRVHLAKN